MTDEGRRLRSGSGSYDGRSKAVMTSIPLEHVNRSCHKSRSTSKCCPPLLLLALSQVPLTTTGLSQCALFRFALLMRWVAVSLMAASGISKHVILLLRDGRARTVRYCDRFDPGGERKGLSSRRSDCARRMRREGGHKEDHRWS